MHADTQPIIIGVAQQVWRERDVSRTPVDALRAVAEGAFADTGSAKVPGAVDSIVHIPFIMNQVPDLAGAMPRNPGAALAQQLGISAEQYTADVGGNLPQQLLSEFAARLSRGEGSVVLLCGVELLASFLGAVRAGEGFPDWASGREDEAQQIGETPVMTAASELAHGLYEPINAYPLFETALRHHHGLSLDAHRKRLGELVSSMSAVSAANPYAWKTRAFSPEEVLSTEGGNRMISYPYTKLMNAIIGVDQAAAVVLTTVGKARELGVDPDRWIYLRGAAGTHDCWFLSQRESLAQSPAMAVAARAALERSALSLEELSHFDLYSCFPSAVQIGCDALGLAVDDPRGVTVTGGLSLFGGPGNNYSLHAIATMTERLRETTHGAGLVWANGGYLTKHAIGLYSRRAPDAPWSPGDDGALQKEVDARQLPALSEQGGGRLSVEAYTVCYSGHAPSRGIVLGSLADGSRCVAIASEQADIARLLAEDCVGAAGQVSHSEGTNHFRF
jgi:acetyl-CoA C-acetyltransferase